MWAWGRGSWRGSQCQQWVSEDGVWLGGGGWGPAQGMVRWNGLLIPQRGGTLLLPMSPPPPPHSTHSKRSGQGRCKETVNSGAASSLSLVRSESSDRAPVPPLPFSQVVLETQACWLERDGSLGPCPPPPLHHPAKPGTSPALAQAKRGSCRPGQGGAEPRSAPQSGPSPWEDEDGSRGLRDWAEPLWTLQWVGFP